MVFRRRIHMPMVVIVGNAQQPLIKWAQEKKQLGLIPEDTIFAEQVSGRLVVLSEGHTPSQGPAMRVPSAAPDKGFARQVPRLVMLGEVKNGFTHADFEAGVFYDNFVHLCIKNKRKGKASYYQGLFFGIVFLFLHNT